MNPIQFSRRQLDQVIRALTRDDLPGLGAYVTAWLRADKDYDRWADDNPPLAKKFKRDFEGLRPVAEFDEGQPLALEGDVAAFLFAELLINPLRNELHRCPGCGTYFRTSARNKYFCARPCLIQFRAHRAMDIDRAKKLVEVDRLVSAHGDDPDWKQWVAARNRLGFKRTFLTCAVQRGWLTAAGHLTPKSFEFLRGLRQPWK